MVVGGASGVVTKVYDGENGKTPVKGIDYFDGEPGTNGLSAYLHIRYSQNSNGNPMTSDPTGAKYVGMQASQNPNPSTVPADYDWTLVKGADGIPGEPGENGQTSYLHIKYSNDGGQTFTGNGGEDAGSWMGQYVDFTQADSTDVKKYAWSKIKGEDGKKGDKGDPGNQGIPGEPGENGKTPYTHYAYAWSADGTDRFTDTYPNENLARTMALSGHNTDASNTVIIAKDKTVISCAGRQHIGLRIWDAEKKLKANTTYYFQFDFKVTSGSVARIGGHLTNSFVSVEGLKINGTPVSGVWANGIACNFVNGTTYHIEFKATSKANPDEGTQGMFIQPNRATYGISYGVEISKLKQEESMSPTIYTPSPSDDFENAYPTYSGTYTDYTAQDSQNPVDYVWSRILGNGGQDGNDGVGIASTAITYQASTSGTTAPTGTWSTTIPSVPAGQFLWTKTVTTYTNNTNSTAYTVAKMGSDGKPGSNGVSVSSVVEEYYVSTSPTSQTGGAWSTTVPNNADPNKYIWRRLKTTMSDSTVTYTNPALIQGMTGIYPYIGPTQPANPKEGQQWWKSDASGNVTNFYVYKSGSWQGQTIQQSVLNIIELNAVTITGSTITGTTINGGVISGAEMHSGLYTLTYKDAPLSIPGSGEEIYGNGTMIISLGTISDSCTAYKADSTVPLFDAFMQLKHNRIVFFKNAPAPSYQRLKQVEIGYDGLYITNEENFPGYNAATLTFQDLMTMPATLIPASSGFSQYATSGDNAPLVSRQGRVVQLSGAFKNNAVLESGASGTMGILPVWARPERAALMRVQASYNNTYLLTINTNGTITMSRHAAGANNVSVPAGSWLNIAIVYAAADI